MSSGGGVPNLLPLIDRPPGGQTTKKSPRLSGWYERTGRAWRVHVMRQAMAAWTEGGPAPLPSQPVECVTVVNLQVFELRSR